MGHIQIVFNLVLFRLAVKVGERNVQDSMENAHIVTFIFILVQGPPLSSQDPQIWGS